MTRRNRRRLWKCVLAFLAWRIPSPVPSSWPTDLLVAPSRAREVAWSLLPDVPTTAPRGNAHASAPSCAGATQINATIPAFEDMYVNDCNRMVALRTDTRLTPGTGQLRLNLYASLDPATAHASATIANATQTNSTTQ